MATKTTKKAAAPKTKNVANSEIETGRIINLFIYAGIADRLNESDDPEPKYSATQQQSYANLCKPKDDQLDSVTSIFTISSECRQTLAVILATATSELKNAELSSTDDTPDKIRAKFEAGDDDSFMLAIFKASVGCKFGPVLSSASDEKSYIRTYLTSQTDALKGKDIVAALVSNEITMFMKAVANSLAKVLFYTRQSVNSDTTFGFLALHGFKPVQLYLIQNKLRVKAPVVRKAKVDTKPADVATDAKSTDEAKPADAATPTDSKPTDSKPTNIPTATDEIADALNI